MLPSVLSLAFAGALAAPADFQYQVGDHALRVTAPSGRSYSIELPCTGVATAIHASRLYVACGDDGVAVLSLESPSTPQFLGQRELGGTVVGFHEADGALWAEIVRREARVVGEPAVAPSGSRAPGAPGGSPATPPALASGGPTTPAPRATEAPGAAAMPATGSGTSTPGVQRPSLAPPEMVPMGEVVEARGSRAVVDLGRSHGLAPGDRVGFYVMRQVPLGGGQVAQTEDVLAVGMATVVGDRRSEVELGVDEMVPTGASARRTTAPVTASRWLPPRATGVWEVAFTLRPFLPLGSVGVGTVSDASVGVRLPGDVHLAALFEPLGVGLAKDGNLVAAAGNVVAAYDTRWFEVGLGAGWSTVNTEAAIPRTDQSGTPLAPEPRPTSGFSLAQVARLGAQDGLHLAARNTFVLYRSQFHYGGTVGELMVPATERAWIFGRGGGGPATGYAYGELGLRLLLRGNGGPQSLFASASLGGAGVWGKKEIDCGGPPGAVSVPCYSDVSHGGPMVGFGLEWRP